LTRNFSRSNRL